MFRSKSVRVGMGLFAIGAPLHLYGCASEVPQPPPGSEPSTGGGSYGGTSSTGGAPSSGGAGSGANCSTDLSSYTGSTIEMCSGACTVNLPVSSFSPCEMIGCNTAHCVPASAVPSSVPLELLGPCADPTTVCIPDDYTASFGKFQAKTCQSILGAEGRCISTCIPQVNGLMDALPKDVCGDNERCAPCINPNDGTDTGACTQGCDTGPSAETKSNPILFDQCANGGGRCVPKSIIPPALQSELLQLTCKSTDELCAPLQKTQNLKYNFPECTPSDGFVLLLATPGPNGQLGGCVPQWLADGNPLEGLFLLQDNCAAGQKCAPCNDPLKGNAPTGACPVPLPSDPTGGLPPDGSTGTGGTTSTGGTTGTGGTTSTGGTVGTGGTTSAGTIP